MSDLPKPDLLHTMQIDMLHYLHKWIFHFIKMHEWLDKYYVIWVSMPAYHNLTQNNTSYEEVSQWNEKERKEMSWYLLGVVTQTPRGRSPAQCSIFNRPIQGTQGLLEFSMYARYKSHDDATLNYMEDTLRRSHTSQMFSYSGGLRKRQRPRPMHWQQNLWRSERLSRKQMLEPGRPPTSDLKGSPGGI